MASKKVLSADNQQERSKELNPWYIIGFVEGEGTFHIAFYKDPRMKTGIKVIPEFHVNQSYLRIITLEKIRNFFNCGYIKDNHKSKITDTTKVYVVRDRKDLLLKIIPFFDQYPLISEKQNSFRTFKQIITLMNKGMHRNQFGVNKIIRLAYKMNNSGRYRRVNKETLLKSSETIRQTLNQ